jgi:Flp pilus assembly protein CpaB
MATGRRRGRAFIFIALILILLLVLVWAVLRVQQGGIGGIGQPPPTPEVVLPTATPPAQVVNIVMSTQPISRGTIISDQEIALVPIPATDYVEGTFFQNMEDVIGTRARYDLVPRTPLTDALLVPANGSVSAFDIPRGMVAISIPIGKLSSVSYGLLPGDHVNVITTLLLVDIDPNFQSILPNLTTSVTAPGQVDNAITSAATIASGIAGRAEFDPTLGTAIYVNPSEIQRPRMVSQTLIQDAVVLQMGIFAQESKVVIQPTAVPDPNQPAQPAAEPTAIPAVPVPDVITLIVNPQDAVTLNYLMLAGARLNLVMRAAGDDQRTQTEAVTLQFVLDQYNIPNPAKLPYSMEPRVNDFFDFIPPFPEAGKPVETLPTSPN